MYRTIIDQDRICKYQTQMYRDFLHRTGTQKLWANVGHQGRLFRDAPLLWAEDLSMWLFYRVYQYLPEDEFDIPIESTTSRAIFWNAVGTTDPTMNRSLPITVEINLSLNGSRRVGGILFEDENSRSVWLGHRGNNIARLGNRFWDHYDGRTAPVYNHNWENPIQYAVIGEIGEASFFQNVADFVTCVENAKVSYKE